MIALLMCGRKLRKNAESHLCRPSSSTGVVTRSTNSRYASPPPGKKGRIKKESLEGNICMGCHVPVGHELVIYSFLGWPGFGCRSADRRRVGPQLRRRPRPGCTTEGLPDKEEQGRHYAAGHHPGCPTEGLPDRRAGPPPRCRLPDRRRAGSPKRRRLPDSCAAWQK